MPTWVFLLGIGGGGVLAVTWVGYPTAIYFLSLFFRRHRVKNTGHAEVSVLLATRDEPQLVRRRVRHLLRSRYPSERLEFIVALDAGSQTEPSDLGDLEVGGRVRVVKADTVPGKAAALNRGVEAAAGDIIVFADIHQRFAPETIQALAAAFSDERVGAASGSLVLRRRRDGLSAADLYWRLERWLRKREARIDSPVGVTGAVSAVQKSLWEPLPEGLILDDLYTPMRLVLEGYRIAFVESAIAFETRRPSPTAEQGRKTRTLTGVLQLCAWLPAVLVPWKNRLFLQFFFHKLARLFTPYAATLVMLSGGWAFAANQPDLILPVGLMAMLSTIWVGLGFTAGARSVRGRLYELFLAQIAIVRATTNGLRGRWDVWG